MFCSVIHLSAVVLGSRITSQLASGIPKCSAYCTMQAKTQVKCKDVTLSIFNSKAVTYQSLKGLVRSFVANQNTDAHHIDNIVYI